MNNKDERLETERNELSKRTNIGLITTIIEGKNTNIVTEDISIEHQPQTEKVGGSYDLTLLREGINTRKENMHTENKDKISRNNGKGIHNKVTEKEESKMEQKSNTLSSKEDIDKCRGQSKHSIEINLTDKGSYKEGQTNNKTDITKESIGGRETFKKMQTSKKEQGSELEVPKEAKDSKKEQNVESQIENGKDAIKKTIQKRENQTTHKLTELISNILSAPQDMTKATAFSVRGPINPQTSAHIASILIEETKYKNTVTKYDIIRTYLKKYPRLLEHLKTAMENDTITYATDQYQYKKMVDLITSTEQIINRKPWEMRTRINHDKDENMEFLTSMQNKRKIGTNGNTEVIENGTKEDPKRKKATSKNSRKDK